MKIAVRAFVLSLLVTGAYASAHTGVATLAGTHQVQRRALPVPNCPPGSDPAACNMCQANGWCSAGE